MNWDAIGSIGEVVGAAGVIFTLIYLAAQIRQNTEALKASSLEAVMDSWRVVNREIILANAETRRAFYKGLNDYDSLTQDEKQIFNMTIVEYVLVVHNAWQLNQRGILPDVDLNAWAKFAVAMLRTPGGKEHWKYNREMYTPTIVEYLDSELGRQGANPTLIEIWPHFNQELEDPGAHDSRN